ncbi:hypothetical protein, partial [Luteibaculum oceani]
PSGTNFLTLNLELTTKEGCVNNISKSIRVKQVLAGFFAPSEVCLNDTVFITSNTNNVQDVRYEFGDGQVSSSKKQVLKHL